MFRSFGYLIWSVFLLACTDSSVEETPQTLEEYLNAVTPGVDGQVYSHALFREMLLAETSGFQCFKAVAKKPHGDFFVTINPDGSLTNVASFPEEKNVSCFLDFLEKKRIDDPALLSEKPLNIHLKLKFPSIVVE